MRTPVLAALVLLLCTGCPITPTVGGKTQEVAQDLNMNARFGRMEVAVEAIAPKYREAWNETHRGWGGKIRIADSEMAGVKVVKSKDKDEEAEVIVRVAWYRIEEDELHTTTLKQRYKDVNGEMKLVEEKRLDGDLGLLGENIQPTAAPSDAPHAPKFFPTVRIGGGDDGAVYREGQ